MAEQLAKIELSNAHLAISDTEASGLIVRTLGGVREELNDDPYVMETIRVLPVGGYRSAIGSIWNAVVHDLRSKVIHRSLALFNKSVSVGRAVTSYEDFQNFVNDDQLIEGAYKIGVIGFEASRVLKHAKETRHFFDGHPHSSEPSLIKVLAMMDDCVKYVLSAPYPAQIIDIDDYMKVLDTPSFDRNQVAIEVALSELPEIYKEELANRLFTSYVHPNASSVLRSNVEFVVPILWPVLPKKVQTQVARRVDQEIAKGNVASTEQAFRFVTLVGATSYLTPAARRYKITPLVDKLKKNFSVFQIENDTVKELSPWKSVIPPEIIGGYVSALTATYVGINGSSPQFSRTNFYADGAALLIPGMFEVFDDAAAEAFADFVRTNHTFKNRLMTPAKLTRVRSLGTILLRRVSDASPAKPFLELLVDEARAGELSALLFPPPK
jgi:hypothetical protein